MIFSADATIPVIVVIPTAIHATASFGLLSFYSAVVTKVVLVIPAAATTMAAIVFGLSSFYSAAVTTVSAVNLQSFLIKPTYSESAAASIRRSTFAIMLLLFSFICYPFIL